MTISKLSLLTLPIILFIGCSRSPKDAVDNMYDALQSGNVVKLANNAAEPMSIALMSGAIKDCSIDKDSYSDKIKLTNNCLKEKYGAITYKDIKTTDISQEKAHVEVTVIRNNKAKPITLTVEKIDGKWMVSSRKKQ